jgi:hypothetical protein
MRSFRHIRKNDTRRRNRSEILYSLKITLSDFMIYTPSKPPGNRRENSLENSPVTSNRLLTDTPQNLKKTVNSSNRISPASSEFTVSSPRRGERHTDLDHREDKQEI